MNNSLQSLHSDFAGAISGRELPPPSTMPVMFDHLAGRNAASYFPPASAAFGSYRSYADAIMGGRYAGNATAGLASADTLLSSLSQELRRNPFTPLGGFGDGFGVSVSQHHRNHQASLLLEKRLIQEEKLLQEERLLRQYDAHNRVLEAELNYRALRDQIAAQNQHSQNQQQSEMLLTDSLDRRIMAIKEHQAQQRLAATAAGGAAGELGSLGWAASQAYGGYANAEQLQLAEESAAIRERLARRRLLHHHQGAESDNAFIHSSPNTISLASTASTASSDTLTRLLQVKQLSDEDLIRRATEVHQNSILREGLGLDPRSGAGRSAVDSLLERQIMEAHLLRSGAGGGGIGVGGLMRFNPGGAGHAGISGDGIYLNLIQQAYADAALGLRGLGAHGGGGPPPTADAGYTTVAACSTQSQPSNLVPKQQDQQETLRYFKNGMEVDKDGNPLTISSGGSAISIAPKSPVVLPQGSLGSLDATGNVIYRFITAVMKRVPEVGPALAVLIPEGLIPSEFPHVVDATVTVLRSIQERCARATDDVTYDLHRRITACIALIESNSADLGLGVPVSGGGVGPGSAFGSLPTCAAMRHAQLLRMGIEPNTYQTLPSPNNHRLDLAGGGFATAGGGSMVPYPISEEQLATAHHHENQQPRMISYQSGDIPEDKTGYAPLKENSDMSHHDVARSESPVDDNMPMMAMYKSKKKAAMRAMKAEKRKRKPKLVHKANAPLKTVDPTPKKSLVQKLVQHALFRGGFDPNAIAASDFRDAPIETSASPENSDGSSSKSDDAKELASADVIESAAEVGESPAKKRRVVNQSNSNVDNNEDVSVAIDQESSNAITDIGDANEAECERSAGDETEKDIVRNGGSPRFKGSIDKPVVEPSSREAASTPEHDAVSVLMGLMDK
ncbi:hypothetical protein ACHAXA_008051 [Cyclostephanos tholiformis]|uniref:Uncharacterized protein n=1 Tax=Cyclostephanos tholiformis TaxID=382380 RepID=A0ABD3SEM5_9STRA